MKTSIAPRFKVEIIKECAWPEHKLFLNPGQVIDGLCLHNKPIDGIRWYYKNDGATYILLPLDYFKILERY
jgi:hypothetical protein